MQNLHFYTQSFIKADVFLETFKVTFISVGNGSFLRSYFIAVTEHRSEDSLQQRQDVFVRLKQAAHRLQLHHAGVRTFSD